MLIPVDREAFLPLLLWSFAVGILLGAVYDLFRIRRVAFRLCGVYRKHEGGLAGFLGRRAAALDTAFVFVEDIAFLLLCAFCCILIHFKLSYGLPRWYSLAATAGGFLLYHGTVGRLVIRSAEAIVSFAAAVCRFLIRHTVLPAAGLTGKAVGALLTALHRLKLRRHTTAYENRLLSSVSSLFKEAGEAAAEPESGSEQERNGLK